MEEFKSLVSGIRHTDQAWECSFLWFFFSYYCSVCSCSLLLPLFFLLILLFPPFLLLAVCLFVSLSFFALWDLLPSCFTSLTMKQMLILIILLAEISLWSNLMLREQLLHIALQGDCCCASKCDLVAKAMQDTPLESCYTYSKPVVHAFLLPNTLQDV